MIRDFTHTALKFGRGMETQLFAKYFTTSPAYAIAGHSVRFSRRKPRKLKLLVEDERETTRESVRTENGVKSCLPPPLIGIIGV